MYPPHAVFSITAFPVFFPSSRSWKSFRYLRLRAALQFLRSCQHAMQQEVIRRRATSESSAAILSARTTVRGGGSTAGVYGSTAHPQSRVVPLNQPDFPVHFLCPNGPRPWIGLLPPPDQHLELPFLSGAGACVCFVSAGHRAFASLSRELHPHTQRGPGENRRIPDRLHARIMQCHRRRPLISALSGSMRIRYRMRIGGLRARAGRGGGFSNLIGIKQFLRCRLYDNTLQHVPHAPDPVARHGSLAACQVPGRPRAILLHCHQLLPLLRRRHREQVQPSAIGIPPVRVWGLGWTHLVSRCRNAAVAGA